MRRIIILLICCVLLLLSVRCRKEPSVNNNAADNDNFSTVENQTSDNLNNVNIQSNLISGGHVIECGDIIVFDSYIYDKTSGDISLLCKDPVCNHTQNINTGENSCILLKNLLSMQIYNGKILCICNPSSNKIYELEPETGTLSVFYEAEMTICGFRLYGGSNAVIHSGDGMYSLNFETGESLKLLDGAIYNAFYTNDNNYLYISMENLTLHRIDLYTGENIVLAERGAQPVINGGKLYYQYISEEEWELYSINIDGSDNKLILEDVSSYSVYDDKIYYSTASYPRKSMICDIDGKNSKEVFNNSASFYIFPESKKVIMWEDSDCTYKIMNLDGSNIMKLTVPQWE